MKFVYFLVLALSLGQGLKAQYPSIFGQTSTEWEFEWFNLPGSSQSTAWVVGDTILHGVYYKMVDVDSLNAIHSAPALLREDTTVGKVWYRALSPTRWSLTPAYDTIEILLFDFSLNQGDTFHIEYPDFYQRDTFALVDSVYYDDYGRKCLQLRGGTWMTMIAGVGSNAGVLFRHEPLQLYIGQHLLCYHRDGQRMYLNAFWGTCLVHDGSSTNRLADALIRVYPNPAQVFLNLNYRGEDQVVHWRVLDLNGRVRGENPRYWLEANKDWQMDLSDYTPGVYILQVWGEGMRLTQLKFIKQ